MRPKQKISGIFFVDFAPVMARDFRPEQNVPQRPQQYIIMKRVPLSQHENLARQFFFWYPQKKKVKRKKKGI